MFSNARSADKVVKILNFKQIHDPFHGKDVLSLGDQGSVEYSSKEIPFESVKQVSHTLNQITSLSKLNEICVDEIINIEAFISVEQAEPTDISTKFGLKKKVEALETDDTCAQQVRLCIWGDHIQKFKCDGSHKI